MEPERISRAEHFRYEPGQRGGPGSTLGSAHGSVSRSVMTDPLISPTCQPPTTGELELLHYERGVLRYHDPGHPYWVGQLLLVVMGLPMSQVFFSGGTKRPGNSLGVAWRFVLCVLAFNGYICGGSGRVLGLCFFGRRSLYSPFAGTHHPFLMGGT